MAEKITELLPAYLVIGDDLLKRERVLKRLRMRLEELGDLAFNSDTFDGAESTAEAILAACKTVPFASEKRLVVVENASKLKKKDAEEVTGYLGDPVASTVLIMIADALPKNSPLLKAVQKLGKSAVIDCAPPKKKDLPSQVVQMARTHGIEVTLDGARTLVALIGENTVHIDEELKKLALAHGASGAPARIGSDEVREAVAHIQEYKPWDFVDAFSKRDIAACVRMRSHMASTSSHVLLRQCVTRIREMICAKVMAQEGGDVGARIASALGLPPRRAFVANYRVDQARNFTMDELTSGLASSVDTERAMKSGTDPDIAFEEWVYSLMGVRA